MVISIKNDIFVPQNNSMATHNELGKLGEEKAQQYLLSKEYKIRHCNWRSGRNELDIIAEKDGVLIIVEVKSRSSNYFGEPEEAVSEAKISRIVAATNDYVCDFNLDNEIRFDIISIVMKDTQTKTFHIEHIEDAFLPPLCGC